MSRLKQQELGASILAGTPILNTEGINLMIVTDINQYRQEREDALNDAFNTPDYVFELHELNMALADEEVWLEYARQALYPPLRCIKGGSQ